MSCHCSKKATHGFIWKEPIHCKLHAIEDEISTKNKCNNNECNNATKKEDTLCISCTSKMLNEDEDINRVNSEASNASNASNTSVEVKIESNQDYKSNNVIDIINNNHKKILYELSSINDQMRYQKELLLEHKDKKDDFNDLKDVLRVINDEKELKELNELKDLKISKKILDSKIMINVLATNNSIWSVKGFMNEDHPVCIGLLSDLKKPGPKDMKSVTDIFTRHSFTLIIQKSTMSKEYFRTKDIPQPVSEIIYDMVYERNI